ncbi:MAG TPA: hypothetical protein VFF28_01685 [Candidatus Nanoarchaeia archaeon]|nr:hypothetical protein [Candidatus Nanoarchaeia archaeon]
MTDKKLLIAEHRDLVEALYNLAKSQIVLAKAIRVIGSDSSMPASVSNYIYDKEKQFKRIITKFSRQAKELQCLLKIEESQQ